MFDCTRCRRAAALVMPPASPTALKIWSAMRSMGRAFSFRDEDDLNYSFFRNGQSTYTAPMSPLAVAAAGHAALAVGMGIGRFAFTPVLPLMQAEGLLDLAAGGWLAAANYAGYLAGALSAPLLSRPHGVRLRLAGNRLPPLGGGGGS